MPSTLGEVILCIEYSYVHASTLVSYLNQDYSSSTQRTGMSVDGAVDGAVVAT